MLVVKPLFEATFAVICFCFLIFMRIFQIITLCELGGAQSVVVNLSNSLCKQHEVIVAAGEGDGKMWGLMDASIKQEHLPSLRISGTMMRKILPVPLHGSHIPLSEIFFLLLLLHLF